MELLFDNNDQKQIYETIKSHIDVHKKIKGCDIFLPIRMDIIYQEIINLENKGYIHCDEFGWISL